MAGVVALACLGLGCGGGSSDISSSIATSSAPAGSEPAPSADTTAAPTTTATTATSDPAADYALADVSFDYLVAPDSTVAQTLAALQNPAAGPDADSGPADSNPTAGSLADFAGRPLVINFWASWCPPCVLEMPEFEKVHQALGSDVAFLGVNVQDGPEDALNLATQTGVSYPLAADPQADIQFDFAIISLPATLFISADGQELDRWLGVLDEDELVNRITANFGKVGAGTSVG